MSIKICLALLMAMSIAACKGKSKIEADHHGHEHGGDGHGHEETKSTHEEETLSFTGWTKKTELFLERPDLKAKVSGEFLAHVTVLDGFTPLTEGTVSVVVQTNEGEKVFSVCEPSRPGIFKPVVTIDAPGEYKAVLTIRSKQLNDQIDLGELEVHGPEPSHHEHDEKEHGTESAITYLKEQQWQTEFATAWAENRTVHKTLTVPGIIQASTRDRVLIKAPSDGVAVGSILPLGVSLKTGDTAIRIKTAEGLVPVLSEKPAVVAVVHVSAGDDVKAGQTLFTLLDMSKVWVEARIYEADLPIVGQSKGAVVEVAGLGRKEAALINSGGALDHTTRTVPFLFEMNNENGQVRVGMTAQVSIRTGDSATGPAIPASAIVDDGGQPVVYVQVEGEAFERRQLILGQREGDWVPVLAGLNTGERIVVEGGHNIRMAGSSGSIPAHLH